MSTLKQLSTPVLDMSTHTLNTSSSKQKFSFPKSDRFGPTRRSVCDSYYEIPSTRMSRAPSFGYGHKDIGIRDDKSIPPPASYNLDSDFAPEKKNRGVSFGTGRQQMLLGGPLAGSLLQKYIPGPGRYKNDLSTLMRDQNVTTLKSRLPDRSHNYLLKNPGPGSYTYEELGKGNYYVTSQHPNKTNMRISPGSRLEPINRSLNVGPGQYNTIQTDMNPRGRYVLSKNEGARTRYFDKSPRQSLQYKHMLSTPGPKYALFSEFG